MAAIGLGRSEGAAACHRAAEAPRLRGRAARGRQGGAGPREAGRRDRHRRGRPAPARARRSDRTGGDPRSRSGAPRRGARADAVAPLRAHRRPGHRRMGKDISGAGMDTNIIGRGVDGLPVARRRSDVGAIWVRSLTPAGHGNAIGIGLADVASKSLVDAIDPDAIFANALSSMTPTTPKTPMHFATDRECLRGGGPLLGQRRQGRRHRPHQEHAGARPLRRVGDVSRRDRQPQRPAHRVRAGAADVRRRRQLRVVGRPAGCRALNPVQGRERPAEVAVLLPAEQVDRRMRPARASARGQCRSSARRSRRVTPLSCDGGWRRR